MTEGACENAELWKVLWVAWVTSCGALWWMHVVMHGEYEALVSVE